MLPLSPTVACGPERRKMKRKQAVLAAVMAAWALALAVAGGVLLIHTARWSPQPVPQAAVSARAAPTLPSPPEKTPVVDITDGYWITNGFRTSDIVAYRFQADGSYISQFANSGYSPPGFYVFSENQLTIFDEGGAVEDQLEYQASTEQFVSTSKERLVDQAYIDISGTAVPAKFETATLTHLNEDELGHYVLYPEKFPEPSHAVVSTSAPSPTAEVLTQADKIQKIRDWYQEIRGFQLRAVYFGDAAGAYWHGDDLVICEYYEEGDVDMVNPIGTTYRYYYRDGEPFFTHFTGVDRIEGNALRLYFWDGELIRWKENQDAPHDGSHATYADYYEQAVYHYNNMVDMPNGLEY